MTETEVRALQRLAHVVGRAYGAGVGLPADVVDAFLAVRAAEAAAWQQEVAR